MRTCKQVIYVVPMLLICATATAQLPLGANIYGRINLSVEEQDLPDSHHSRLESNASRLGIRGDFAITEGIELVYQLEYQLNLRAREFGGRSWTRRNSYAGFRTGFGEIVSGKHDTPAKMTQNRIDLFNDLIGDIRGVVDGENRIEDIIMYTSPTFSGFEIQLASMSGGPNEQWESISSAISYNNGDFYAAAAINQEVQNHDLWRLVSQYSLGDFTFGALVQQSEDLRPGAGDKEFGAFGSVQWTRGDWIWKAQYGQSDQVFDDGEQLSLGFDLRLATDTKLFTYFTHYGSGPDEQERNFLGIGIEYRF